MAIAEDLAVIHEPGVDDPFRVEQHGIDYIPASERWATPKDIFGMWAGASVQVEYFLYGAILMTFGFTFAQALSLIIIGNLSYLLLGLCSLQGPDAGTSVFAINRAAFGPNGSRPISFFNWVTQIGFEVEGLILIVGAGLVLLVKGGFDPGDPAKVILVMAAVLIQGILPFLGHAAIVKSLRLLIAPFVVLFAIMLGFAIPHANLQRVAHGAGWQTYMAGLAFTIALSGLGWAECGNDYTRYCPAATSKKGIVGWVFLGTAVPEILIMTLGAVIGTFIAGVGTGAGGLLPFAHQSLIPAWFVVVFLLFAVVQLFAINSLDMYSSGVTLQAIGLPGQALPGGADRLRHRVRYHHVCHLQLVVHRVPLRLRRPGDRVDRSVVCHLPGRLGSAAIPLRAERAAKDGPRRRFTGTRVASLACHHRPGGRDVRRHLGAVREPTYYSAALAERDHDHNRTCRTAGLQHLPRHGRSVAPSI